MEHDKLNTSYHTNASFLGRGGAGGGLQRMNDDGSIAEQPYIVSLEKSNPLDITISHVAIDGTGKVVGQYFWAPNHFYAETESIPSIDLSALRLLVRIDKQVVSFDKEGKASETLLSIAPQQTPNGRVSFRWDEAVTDQFLFPLTTNKLRVGLAFQYNDQIGKADLSHPFTFGFKVFTPKIMLNL